MSKLFEATIQDYITRHGLFTGVRRLGVGLSGGADSVCLFRVLHNLGINFAAVHCNFGLRGAESESDQRFVEDLCRRYDIQLLIKRFSGLKSEAAQRGVSIEMICREKRLNMFDELQQRGECDTFALAHHLDDNIETFFLNSLRGTGVSGLAAMQPKSEMGIVRPLLCVTKQQILSYLSEIGQEYVVDSTNQKCDFRRNKLRNIVLPSLYEQFPDARTTLQATIEHAADARQLLGELMQTTREMVCRQNGDLTTVDIHSLKQYSNHRLVLYELLKVYGFNRTQSDSLHDAAIDDFVGRMVESPTHVAVVDREVIEVMPKNVIKVDDSEYELHLSAECVVNTPVFLRVSHSPIPFDKSICDGKWVVAFNSSFLACRRIVLRHWCKGDRMEPFGMNGSKLLSDIFVDSKMGYFDKRAVWLLEADGRIVWVLGVRASRHFAVTPKSTNYLVLEAQL